MNYTTYPWDALKRKAHSNHEVIRTVHEIDGWLLVDDYFPATTVVGTLALEKDLEISDDFTSETEWPDLIVWPFPSTTKKDRFEKGLNRVLYSLMTTEPLDDIFVGTYLHHLREEEVSRQLQNLVIDLFRYEKQTDVKIGRYTWFGYAIDPPFDRFEGKWRWVEIAGDPPVALDILSAAISMIRWHFTNAQSINPRDSPNRLRKALREVGGEYVRTMGRLAFMGKVRKLGELLQKYPVIERDIMAEISNTTPRQAEKSTTNVLVVFANPKGSDPLRLSTEDRVIHECIKLSKHRDNINLEALHAATIHDVRRALLDRDYRIVHFSGHGIGTGLAFENEVGEAHIVPPDALADFLSAYSPPIECVILNACYTNSQGQLLKLGVPYTIATEGSISDSGATEFTRGFYDAIGAGKNVEFAYQEGCRTIKLTGHEASSIPILLRK